MNPFLTCYLVERTDTGKRFATAYIRVVLAELLEAPATTRVTTANGELVWKTQVERVHDFHVWLRRLLRKK